MKLQVCRKCKHEYHPCSIRKCPYSEKGLYICVYCCKRCPYVKEVQLGWICTYGRKR
nr:MAG TPA: RRN7 Zinc-finger of RNA-polymerase I-specific TFIIB, Rrn7 [Caudoviricetes sp.]